MKKIGVDVLGAGYEIGRNCFILTYPTGEKILLDCGLNADNTNGQEGRYPMGIKKLGKVDLTLVSHPHLDHVGGLPRACMYGLSSPIIIPNHITRGVSEIILSDSLKLEKMFYGSADYGIGWIRYALMQMKVQMSGKCGNVSFRLITTSHIPGGASILLEHPQTRSILYTGDIKMSKTQLMEARTNLAPADVIFIDSTYGNSVHPDRKKTEEKFKKIITKAIKAGGRVVIPCFSVARSQEILILLDKIREELKVPVYLDGMGRGVTRVYLRHAKELDDEKLLQAVQGIKFIKTKPDRIKALREPSIIVPSGGMGNSPLVHFYIEGVAPDHDSAILFTGFQAKGTGGHELTTKGTLTISEKTNNKRKIIPKCGIHHLSFSSHADAEETEEIIKTVNPELVVAIHGERPGINGVKGIAKKLNIDAIAPKTGETIFL